MGYSSRFASGALLVGAGVILFMCNDTIVYQDIGMGYETTLAVCTMTRDDAPYLQKWLLFHRALGVEHFYIYDHGSTDGYADVVKPYVESGLVTSIPWPPETYDADPGRLEECLQSMSPKRWVVHRQATCQFMAFDDCLERAKAARTEWLGVYDIDEYMYTPGGGVGCQHGSLRRALREQPMRVATIVVNGWVAGTQGYERPEQAPVVTRDYQYRNPADGTIAGHPVWENNDALKSFGRTALVARSRIHWFDKTWAAFLSLYSHRLYKLRPLTEEHTIRMRHYTYRSYESLRTKAVANGNPYVRYRAERDYWNSMLLDDEVYNCSRSLGILSELDESRSYDGLRRRTQLDGHPPPPPTARRQFCGVVVHSNSSDCMVKLLKSFWSVRRALGPESQVVLVDLVGSEQARAHLAAHAPPGSYARMDSLDAGSPLPCKAIPGGPARGVVWVPRASWEWLDAVLVAGVSQGDPTGLEPVPTQWSVGGDGVAGEPSPVPDMWFISPPEQPFPYIWWK